jgi:hypothetical protein
LALVQLDVYGEVAAVTFFGPELLRRNERRLLDRLSALAGNLGSSPTATSSSAGNRPATSRRSIRSTLAAMSAGQVDAKVAVT